MPMNANKLMVEQFGGALDAARKNRLKKMMGLDNGGEASIDGAPGEEGPEADDTTAIQAALQELLDSRGDAGGEEAPSEETEMPVPSNEEDEEA